MCILFIHTDPEPKEDGYRLILASNRDEYYVRPAAVAKLCPETKIIGGMFFVPLPATAEFDCDVTESMFALCCDKQQSQCCQHTRQKTRKFFGTTTATMDLLLRLLHLRIHSSILLNFATILMSLVLYSIEKKQ